MAAAAVPSAAVSPLAPLTIHRVRRLRSDALPVYAVEERKSSTEINDLL
jgi:hypothetical protein